MDCIPVVDFSPISTKNGRVPSEVDWELVAKEIDRVLTGIGFVYIKNHGIPQEKVKSAQINITVIMLNTLTKLQRLVGVEPLSQFYYLLFQSATILT